MPIPRPSSSTWTWADRLSKVCRPTHALIHSCLWRTERESPDSVAGQGAVAWMQRCKCARPALRIQPLRSSLSSSGSPRGLSEFLLPIHAHLSGALVSPPVALAIDVFARSLAEIGRADDEDLEALRPGLVASPRTGRDAHSVPFLEPDDLVVELHAPAPAYDHVHLLLGLVRVAIRKAIAGRD